jgi:hypothetical protein
MFVAAPIDATLKPALYAELAQQVEGRSAYSEAARILTERLESKAER